VESRAELVGGNGVALWKQVVHVVNVMDLLEECCKQKDSKETVLSEQLSTRAVQQHT
jgi:hypothetical protein